jgi:hypothetical protein
MSMLVPYPCDAADDRPADPMSGITIGDVQAPTLGTVRDVAKSLRCPFSQSGTRKGKGWSVRQKGGVVLAAVPDPLSLRVADQTKTALSSRQ